MKKLKQYNTEGRLDIVEYSQMPKMVELCKYYNRVNFGTPATYEEVMISDYIYL